MSIRQPIAVTGGLVQGIPAPSDSAITEFRAIPYAADPSGENRFKPPQAVVPWDGVRICDTNSPVNYQMPPPPTYFDTLAGVPQSEDILYLNVWVPGDKHNADKPYPVFMWIHGGGYREGGNADKNFDGTGLAQKGVIVVVPNFRLGMLGFFAHPELSKESPSGTSGNQGLLDCIQALQWIQTNISKFCGDPSRVTIGGQSSGATMTGILLYSPLTKGLLHGAIFQSGTRHPRDPLIINIAGAYGNLKEAEQDGVNVVKEMGVSGIDELRKYPDPVKFAEMALKRDGRLWGPPPLFRAVLDGYVLTQTYSETFLKGHPNDVPVIAGHTSEEGAVYAEPRFTMDDLRQCVSERFGAGSSWEKRFYEIYPVTNEEEGKGPLDTWNNSCREHTKTNLSLFAQEWSRKAKSPVFGYYFTHAPRPFHGFSPDFSRPKVPGFTFGKGPLVGAFHSADLAYTFNSLVSNEVRPWTDRDRKVGENVSTLWSNFIKHGDPNGRPGSSQDRPQGVDEWPNLVTNPTTVLELGGDFSQINVAQPEGRQFWSDFILSQSKAW